MSSEPLAFPPPPGTQTEILRQLNEPKPPPAADSDMERIADNAGITHEGKRASVTQGRVSSQTILKAEHSEPKGVGDNLKRMSSSVASRAENPDATTSSEHIKNSEESQPKPGLATRIKQKFDHLRGLDDPLKKEYLTNQANKSIVQRAKELVTRRPDNLLRTALTSATLAIVWAASASTSKIPILRQLVFRSEMKEGPPSTTISSDSFEGDAEVKTRFQNHSIYLTYPTQPIELSKNHQDIFKEMGQPNSTRLGEFTETLNKKFENNPQLENKDVLAARMELLESYTKGTPYKDLSPNARNLFNVINLHLIKEHLDDTQELGNNPKNREQANLDHLSLNYFENEVHDTLARGLAYIDPALLQGETFQVPVKQSDGSFKTVEYSAERFNLSGEKNPLGHDQEGKINHNIGHPIFFLTPKKEGEASPMIVARGTILADAKGDRDGAKASIEADGRKDISLKWITQNKELAPKMKEISDKHGFFHVMGHSLGGNIALTLSIAFHNQIDRTVAISAPHVSQDVYQIWEKIPETQRPHVDNLMVEGDLVSGNGDRIMGNAIKVEQQDAKGKPDLGDNAIDRHLKPFNNKRVRYAAVDIRKEESKAVRKMATTTTIAMGRFKQSKGFKRKTGARTEALEVIEQNVDTNIKSAPVK